MLDGIIIRGSRHHDRRDREDERHPLREKERNHINRHAVENEHAELPRRHEIDNRDEDQDGDHFPHQPRLGLPAEFIDEVHGS